MAATGHHKADSYSFSFMVAFFILILFLYISFFFLIDFKIPFVIQDFFIAVISLFKTF